MKPTLTSCLGLTTARDFAFLIKWSVSLAFMAVLGCGCKKPMPEISEKPSVAKSRSVSVKDTLTPNALSDAKVAAAASDVGATDILVPVADGDLTETLNSVLTDYADAHDRVPKDLAEMVRLKLIPRIPDAPSGKQYIINAERREIVLADRK